MADAAARSSAMSVAEIDTMRSSKTTCGGTVVCVATSSNRSRRRILRSSCSMPAAGRAACSRTCGLRFPQAALTAMDFGERALELTGQRGLGAELVQGSTDALPFGDAEFDVVLSLDVIVLHGIDDAKAIREMFRVVRPAVS
jgi:SAM-dependent methyltransferase